MWDGKLFHAAGRRERKPSHQTCDGWPAAHNGALKQSTVCLVLVERMLLSLDEWCSLDSSQCARHALASKACMSHSMLYRQQLKLTESWWSRDLRDMINLDATAFWTPCREAIVDCGSPARTELQYSSWLTTNAETSLAVIFEPSSRRTCFEYCKWLKTNFRYRADVFLNCQLAVKKNAEITDNVNGCDDICTDVQSKAKAL